MFTKVADYLLDTPAFPVGQDDGSMIDAALLDRVVPLRLDQGAAPGARPTVRIGAPTLSAKTAALCTGRWQLHLFSFAAEARLAQQTLALVSPETVCEAGSRPTGEGLLLVHEGEGPFACRILDRRRAQGGDAPVGSWEVPAAVARRAALHVPRRRPARAEAAARMLALEFDDPEDCAMLQARLGCAGTERSIGRIRPQDVVNAANRLLEPVGAELSCSDRQVLAAIDAHLATLAPEMEALVERIAHDLVADLAEGGSIG